MILIGGETITMTKRKSIRIMDVGVFQLQRLNQLWILFMYQIVNKEFYMEFLRHSKYIVLYIKWGLSHGKIIVQIITLLHLPYIPFLTLAEFSLFTKLRMLFSNYKQDWENIIIQLCVIQKNTFKKYSKNGIITGRDVLPAEITTFIKKG